MIIERLALETFLDRKLGENDHVRFRLRELQAQGWDVELLLQLVEDYGARTPISAQRFTFELRGTDGARTLLVRQSVPGEVQRTNDRKPPRTAARSSITADQRRPSPARRR